MLPKSESERRADAVAKARSELGKPYYWGSAGPDSFDCNGLVEIALQAGEAYPWPDRRSASHYWSELERIEWAERKPGDIVCYGDATGAHHVMLVSEVPSEPSQEGKQIGACHGGPPHDGESDEAYRVRMAKLGASVIEVTDWYWKTARLGAVRSPRFSVPEGPLNGG